jgi:hypothetical protein
LDRDFNVAEHNGVYKIAIAGKRAITILSDLSTYKVPKLARKWDKLRSYNI